LSSSSQTKRRKGKGNDSYHRLLRSNTPTQEDDDKLSLFSSFQMKRRGEEGNGNCCRLLRNKTPKRKQ